MKTIVIIGRRWFNRNKGHSYYSVQVFHGKELIGETPYDCGYGEEYMQQARALINESTLPSFIKNEYLERYEKRTGLEVLVFRVDVRRRKDL